MTDPLSPSEEARLGEETERLIAAVGHAHWNHAGWNAVVAEENLRRRIRTLIEEARTTLTVNSDSRAVVTHSPLSGDTIIGIIK